MFKSVDRIHVILILVIGLLVTASLRWATLKRKPAMAWMGIIALLSRSLRKI